MVWFGVLLVLFPLLVFSSPVNNPNTNQFHIQTDEGPVRYFKYQTQNGQFRKEKRLQDGTVIGTYAWIDDNGYLRQRDYIADGQGYRIVNNKNVYVGKNMDVGVAVKAVKVSGTGSGTQKIYSPGHSPPPSSTIRPTTIDTSPYQVPLTSPAYDSTLYQTYYHTSSPPSISYRPPSQPKIEQNYPSTSPPQQYLPSREGFTQFSTSSTPPPQVYLPSSTLPPRIYSSTTPSHVFPPTSASPNEDKVPLSVPPHLYLPSSTSSPEIYSPSSTPEYIEITPPSRKYIPQSDVNSNSLEYSDNSPFINPYIHQNGPTYPIDTKGHSFNPTYNNIGNGYDPQYPYYDGISVTNDGFRYYIPKAYHEEQNSGGYKSGSFGYIDPFGIRRVVYYNASPDGFKHRKNNRYVGLNGTPYDPRPY